MSAGPILERNQDATIYVGGLDEKVTEAILWELFVQSGPVVSVNMPKDRITGSHQGFGFVEFMGEEDADYAMKIMNMIKLFGKPIKVNKASANEKNMDVGANLFVGNLDPEVDEKLLFDTFSAFGVILQVPRIMRDTETGNSKGFAFINFASFEASDMAMEAMNGQFLCNRAITCCYAFKKDGKGERHGTAAERLLASQNPLFPDDKPNQMFSDGYRMPGSVSGMPPAMGSMHVPAMMPNPYGTPGMFPPPPPPMGATPTPAPPPPPFTPGFFPPPPPPPMTTPTPSLMGRGSIPPPPPPSVPPPPPPGATPSLLGRGPTPGNFAPPPPPPFGMPGMPPPPPPSR
ncbi:hypothetical protein QR680_005572 [Steinernema hermaphroditum]|uniref:Splicing factor 3B subunit 4 n=1 Tax=Steinernema hermaphroditum TaxID=289476 RepID=A0AA39HTU0_9BILA|nr:hypothetical protein QR680_005572 [Steinernema hermaphroditum]